MIEAAERPVKFRTTDNYFVFPADEVSRDQLDDNMDRLQIMYHQLVKTMESAQGAGADIPGPVVQWLETIGHSMFIMSHLQHAMHEDHPNEIIVLNRN